MTLPGRCAGCGAEVLYARGAGRSATDAKWRDPVSRLVHECPKPRVLYCRKPMRRGEICARRKGHTTECRSRYALDNQLAAKRARAA